MASESDLADNSYPSPCCCRLFDQLVEAIKPGIWMKIDPAGIWVPGTDHS